MTNHVDSRFHPAAKRKGLVAGLAAKGEILEIGPFGNPTLRGANIRYFDVLDQEALCARAVRLGGDPTGVPEVHYVSPHGDLSVVDRSFDCVFSAHCLEHQPDMIHHLRQVSDLLDTGGRYVLVLPDKRYCFDHFYAVSHIGDVLEAHRAGRRAHTLSAVLEGEALATHNNKKLHWLGFHGRPGWSAARQSRIEEVIAQFDAAEGGYIDVHAWQFVPASFLRLMRQLHEMDLIALRPVRVCETPVLRREFTAVLEKV
jgi:SAM-dependent methyltransferase